MSERNIYLEKTDLATAQKITLEKFKDYYDKTQKISASQSYGRILSKPVYARLSAPLFHVAAMDGIALDSSKSFKASKTNPIQLEIGKDAFYINTGEAVPKGTDSVIIIEKINIIDEKNIEIDESCFPWQNIRKTGEDIVATEMIFPALHKISPQDIGALLSGGITEIEVIQQPVIYVIPTGSELISPEAEEKNIKPGAVIESNSHMLCAFIESCGCKSKRIDPVKDDPDILAEVIEKTSKEDDAHMILSIGGSSAGSRDYTKKAIEKHGRVFIHGITIMPGKPAIAGIVNNKPVFGIPGYPVSAAIVFDMLVKPLIFQFLKQQDEGKNTLNVFPVRSIPSKLGVEEFIRVKVGKVNDQYIAAPLPRGAGTITSITEADAIIRIPANLEGITDKNPVSAELLRPKNIIEKTLLMVGSHDNTLDIIAQFMAQKGERLSSTHVGSMGGITAVKKGAAHLAGIHLLDTNTGQYNVSYLQKYMPGKKLKIIHLVTRYQGLIVKKGNPLNIKGLEDLQNSDIRFINRQKGSGTRILTDYECTRKNIDTTQISGFNVEEYTHMGVSAGIKSNAADAGMAIKAAANALNLDFIPVATEDYQIIIPQEYFSSKPVQVMVDIINSAEFKNAVIKAGGYEINRTGEIIDFG